MSRGAAHKLCCSRQLVLTVVGEPAVLDGRGCCGRRRRARGTLRAEGSLSWGGGYDRTTVVGAVQSWNCARHNNFPINPLRRRRVVCTRGAGADSGGVEAQGEFSAPPSSRFASCSEPGQVVELGYRSSGEI